MATFRATIWAAVSTEEQARHDKVSLKAQEGACRRLARSRGWEETAGPYVVAGASRTRWVNLRDAEHAIPELRTMLDDAQAGRFDLLLLFDFNRLRDLLDPVSRVLSAYGCQILSVSQPVEPAAPESFDPYASDAPAMMQGLSLIISRAQVADLRRKYRFAMPKRVTELGLPAISIPYGYSKPLGRETDRKAVPVQVPEQIAVLQEIRAMFMSGLSRGAIAAHLNAHGLASPRGVDWNPITLRGILANPFYAGQVVFGLTRARADPPTGQRRRIRNIPRERWSVGQGKHEPIWTAEQFEEVQLELRRRQRGNTGKHRRAHRFTSLLRCAGCGSTLYRFENGPRSEPDRAIWRCASRHGETCASIVESQAIDQLAGVLRALVETVELPAREEAGPARRLADPRRALSASRARLERYQRAYGDGPLSYGDFGARVAEVEADIAEAQRQLEAAARSSERATAVSERTERMRRILAAMPRYLEAAPPKDVNDALREVFEAIVVAAGGTIQDVRLR